MANKTGRPTKYDPSLCDELLKFFDIEPHFETPVIKTYKNGTIEEGIKFIPSDLPTLAGFAKKIGVHRDTIHGWATATDDKGNLLHPEFSDAIKKAKECQESILVTNGLMGLYSTAFAIFTAKNLLRWTDRQDLTSEGEKLEGLVIVKNGDSS